MESILSQAKRVAEEAEVFTVSSEETTVQFESNRLKHLHTKQATSLALRVIKEGRIGYATTTGMDGGQQLVDDAVETARFGMPVKFQFPGLLSYPQVVVFDKDVELVPVEKMVGLGEEMISAVTGDTPGIVCEAGIIRSVISVRILNSRGGQAEYRKSVFGMGIEGSLINDTDMLFVGESADSCHPLPEANEVTKVVLRQLELANNRASVTGRSLPVIFTPDGVASALLMPLMAAFNGKTVLEGASPIGSKVGQVVFDDKVSLWDDPTISYRPGSRFCDDEGVPSECTTLIEKGKVANFLYDLQTAAQANARSTGNGSRSSGGLPAPSASAFIIAPGDTAFEDMVRDMKEGLIVEHLMGAGQGNVLGGDFSGNVLLGYKVENGEITGRVKDTMVSGNIYQALKKVVAVGNETKWVGGSLQTPHFCCSGLSVASKG